MNTKASITTPARDKLGLQSIRIRAPPLCRHCDLIGERMLDGWHAVQRLIQTVRKPNKYGAINPLTGLLYCTDCGKKITNHRSIDTPVNGKCRNGGFQDVYICSDYRRRPSKCSMHYIRTAVVQSLVLETIRRVSDHVRENEAGSVKKVREASAVQQEQTAKSHRKRLVKNQKRRAELDTLIKRLYEDNVSGKFTDTPLTCALCGHVLCYPTFFLLTLRFSRYFSLVNHIVAPKYNKIN